ncbi:MAG: hypothetical protein LC624_11470, partial [Halobacteriales archaeon]|nr:hypothetical protein [Halobacteriales archaeon]
MDLAAAVGALSGILIAAVGLALLAARPRRPGSRVFALFCLLWGADVVATSMARVTTGPSAETLFRLSQAFTIVETLFLVHFAVSFPNGATRRRLAWTGGAALLTVAVGAWFAVEPAAFGSALSGPPAPASLLIGLPRFAAFYLAAHLLLQTYLHDRTLREPDRKEVAIVLGALALYVGTISPFYLVLYARSNVPQSGLVNAVYL